MVRSPKFYLRDSGILHNLLQIKDYNTLIGNPVYGASWEGMVIENIITRYHDWNPYFYRTSNGAEIDLILEYGNKKIAIECKASTSPAVSVGFYQAMEDLEIKQGYVIAPIQDTYPIKPNVLAIPLVEFLKLDIHSDHEI